MASPIAVQRAEHALALDHLPQSCHHRRRRFLLHQLRVIDLAGGVVQNHDQIVIAVVLKPAVFAPVDVQHHTRHGPPRTAPTVRAPLVPLRHQTGPLQRLLHPAVAEPDPFHLRELLVKVTHVEISILVAV